jgi:hypothetical protein
MSIAIAEIRSQHHKVSLVGNTLSHAGNAPLLVGNTLSHVSNGALPACDTYTEITTETTTKITIENLFGSVAASS